MEVLARKWKKFVNDDPNESTPLEDSISIQRIAAGELNAIDNIIVSYGLIIWTLAKKFTVTTDEAMAAFSEIVSDIIRCAGEFDESQMSLLTFVKQISHRRLMAGVHRSPADAASVNGRSSEFDGLPEIDRSTNPANRVRG